MPTEFRHVQAYQHLEKGQHLESLGLLDEAMLEFKRAVEADPRIATARSALGHHYRRKGLLTKAADEFRSAVRLNQDLESFFNLGRVLTELEQYAEAADLYRRCLRLDPTESSARYELGYSLCGQGKFAEALAEFQAMSQQEPDDWELHFAKGDCHIGLERYADAESELRLALRHAPPDSDTAPVREALLVALRHLEFPPGQTLTVKQRLYAEFGAVCLGSGGDDGLDVPVYKDYTFSYADIAVTLSRLLSLVREHDWQFTAACSMDDGSMPLALALSRVLEVPVLPVEQLGEDDFALVVLGVGRRPELCEVTSERVPARMLSFALAFTWPLEEGVVTDLVGVQCTGACVLPWHATALRRPRRSVRTAATALLRALAAAPNEPNLREQLEYYAQHRLLRFFDHLAEMTDKPPAAGAEQDAAT